MSAKQLVSLRVELFRLSRRYKDGLERRSEMVKLERRMSKIRVKIEKITHV